MSKENLKSVDVIMPIYNSSALIKNTLDIMLTSTYDNYRIIISDDCSSDDTVEIIKEYQVKFPDKILLNVNKVNLGVSINAEICLKLTTADIVMFGAHDDLFYKDKISKCVKCFEDHQDVTLVYHDCDVIINGQKEMKYSDTHYPREGHAWNYLLFGCVSTGPSVCVVGDVAREIGFRKDVGVVSDFLLFYEVAKKGVIKYIPEVLGAYVRHENNLSSALRCREDFGSVRVSLFIMEKYKDDRISSLINFQWGMIRLLSKNKLHLLFYMISPLLTLIWMIGVKLGKKKIP